MLEQSSIVVSIRGRYDDHRLDLLGMTPKRLANLAAQDRKNGTHRHREPVDQAADPAQ
jgi:hypothetical protein